MKDFPDIGFLLVFTGIHDISVVCMAIQTFEHAPSFGKIRSIKKRFFPNVSSKQVVWAFLSFYILQKWHHGLIQYNS